MKLFAGFLAVALSLGQVTCNALNARCNADNCARAVTGTRGNRPSLRLSHLADCTSFMQCTVIPAISTITVTSEIIPTPITITATPTTTVEATFTSLSSVILTFAKRDTVSLHRHLAKQRKEVPAASDAPVTVCATAVPSYAQACSGTPRYESACACFGVSKSVTTAEAPSTTVTATVIAPSVTTTLSLTATSAVVEVEPAPFISAFIIQSGDKYVNTQDYGGLLQWVLQTTDPKAAQTFQLNGTSVFTSDPLNGMRISDTDGGSDTSYLYLDDLSTYDNNNFPAVVCVVNETYDANLQGYTLACTGAGRGTLQVDPQGRLLVASQLITGNVAPAQLVAKYVGVIE